MVTFFTFSLKFNKGGGGNLAKATLLFYHIRQMAARVAMFVLRDAFATPNLGEREVVGVSDGTNQKSDSGFLYALNCEL